MNGDQGRSNGGDLLGRRVLPLFVNLLLVWNRCKTVCVRSTGSAK
jgi:hypothetical protein